MPLRDWSVLCSERDGYTPPEHRTHVLGGRTPQGRVYTSPIVEAKGRTITTRSGTHYRLVGPPAPGYAKWCKDNGITLDLGSPVKIRR